MKVPIQLAAYQQAKCLTCGGNWENHRTALSEAKQHAKLTGHQVSWNHAERGGVWEFGEPGRIKKELLRLLYTIRGTYCHIF